MSLPAGRWSAKEIEGVFGDPVQYVTHNLSIIFILILLRKPSKDLSVCPSFILSRYI